MIIISEFLSAFFRDFTIFELLLCIVGGHIFNSLFRFITSKRHQKDSAHIIVTDILVGYIFFAFYNVLPDITNGNKYLDAILIIVICVIAAYVAARFYNSRLLLKISELLKINKTPCDFVWLDITNKRKNVLFVRCVFYDLELDVIGQLNICEENQRYPQLVLGRYRKSNLYGEEIVDYSDDPNEKILIDTSKADVIELTYRDGDA